MGFEGFRLAQLEVGEVSLRVCHGGCGPPLVLLHGYPQTHMMWGQVATELAEDFTVVVPDLRGYGDSSKPAAVPDHESYSKRVMAGDVIGLMDHFGFDSFDVAGHDRGGRVAYRLPWITPRSCVGSASWTSFPPVRCGAVPISASRWATGTGRCWPSLIPSPRR